jgi:hypothetical protein
MEQGTAPMAERTLTVTAARHCVVAFRASFEDEARKLTEDNLGVVASVFHATFSCSGQFWSVTESSSRNLHERTCALLAVAANSQPCHVLYIPCSRPEAILDTLRTWLTSLASLRTKIKAPLRGLALSIHHHHRCGNQPVFWILMRI